MSKSFTTLDVQNAGGVFTIALQRPAVLNALTADMCVELGTALRLAQRDEAVRCVVLTGKGRAFCAGQDLQTLRPAASGRPLDLGAYLREMLNPIVLRLRTMEKPVVAAINGVAAGAGASLALAADLRICARSASLIMSFVKVGLVPDAGATLTLVQQIGYARAAEMCLLGEPVVAEEALRTGLVNRVVADEDLAGATRELAEKLARGPTGTLGLIKRALQHAWEATLEEQLRYEAYLQSTAGGSEDHQEGVAAFLGKRPPEFKGR